VAEARNEVTHGGTSAFTMASAEPVRMQPICIMILSSDHCLITIIENLSVDAEGDWIRKVSM
jgi:hypothetical protein